MQMERALGPAGCFPWADPNMCVLSSSFLGYHYRTPRLFVLHCDHQNGDLTIRQLSRHIYEACSPLSLRTKEYAQHDYLDLKHCLLEPPKALCWKSASHFELRFLLFRPQEGRGYYNDTQNCKQKNVQLPKDTCTL